MATNPYPGVTIGGGAGTSYTSPITISGAGSGATWVNSTASTTTAQGKLKLEGKEADIFINGQSLSDWMSAVDRRLSILQPKPELLEKYEALQAAYDHYKTLESLLYEQE
jgi:hypothetical protein